MAKQIKINELIKDKRNANKHYLDSSIKVKVNGKEYIAEQ